MSIPASAAATSSTTFNKNEQQQPSSTSSLPTLILQHKINQLTDTLPTYSSLFSTTTYAAQQKVNSQITSSSSSTTTQSSINTTISPPILMNTTHSTTTTTMDNDPFFQQQHALYHYLLQLIRQEEAKEEVKAQEEGSTTTTTTTTENVMQQCILFLSNKYQSIVQQQNQQKQQLSSSSSLTENYHHHQQNSEPLTLEQLQTISQEKMVQTFELLMNRFSERLLAHYRTLIQNKNDVSNEAKVSSSRSSDEEEGEGEGSAGGADGVDDESMLIASVIEKYMMEDYLYEHVFVSCAQDAQYDDNLSEKLNIFATIIQPKHLDIQLCSQTNESSGVSSASSGGGGAMNHASQTMMNTVRLIMSEGFRRSVKWFRAMNKHKTVCAKMKCLELSFKSLFHIESMEQMDGDSLISLIIFLTMYSNMRHLHSTMEYLIVYVEAFYPMAMMGQWGYFLTNLSVAVSWWKSINITEEPLSSYFKSDALSAMDVEQLIRRWNIVYGTKLKPDADFVMFEDKNQRVNSDGINMVIEATPARTIRRGSVNSDTTNVVNANGSCNTDSTIVVVDDDVNSLNRSSESSSVAGVDGGQGNDYEEDSFTDHMSIYSDSAAVLVTRFFDDDDDEDDAGDDNGEYGDVNSDMTRSCYSDISASYLNYHWWPKPITANLANNSFVDKNLVSWNYVPSPPLNDGSIKQPHSLTVQTSMGRRLVHHNRQHHRTLSDPSMSDLSLKRQRGTTGALNVPATQQLQQKQFKPHRNSPMKGMFSWLKRSSGPKPIRARTDSPRRPNSPPDSPVYTQDIFLVEQELSSRLGTPTEGHNNKIYD